MIAKGAAWMVALRLIQRSLGIVSTVVLARLLVPEDFGLVAMAMSFYALVELFSMVGFDLAIIRRQAAERVHFDTAWTLGIGLKSLIAVVLLLGAPYVAEFYKEPRVESVLQVFSLVSLLAAFENIGIVSFRKELEFHREFKFQLAKKVLSVITTVVLAVYFRSYWALVLGVLASTAFGVVLSYVVHPFRPRLTVAAWREMLGFSAAVAGNHLVTFLRDRGPDFIIGRFMSAGTLGAYRVASELASLPTTQLHFPIMRAVFPGYSKVSDDPVRLRAVYLSTQAALATLVMPMSIGVALLAEPFVYLLLGSKWAVAVPLVQIMGITGATRALHGNRHALFMAKGRPHWVGVLVLIEVLILLPLITYLMWKGYPIEMVAWSKMASSLLVLPVAVSMISRVLEMSRWDFFYTVWRPVLGCAAMAGAVLGCQTYITRGGDEAGRVLEILALGSIGAAVYGFTVLLLWLAAGGKDGFESSVFMTMKRKSLLPAMLARIVCR